METFETLTLMLSFGMFVIAILQFNNKAKPVTVLDSKVIREANSGDMKKASDHYAVYVDVKL